MSGDSTVTNLDLFPADWNMEQLLFLILNEVLVHINLSPRQ